MGASPSRDAQQRMLDALCSTEALTDQKKKRQVVLVPLTSSFMNRVSTSATTSELRLDASPEELPLVQQLMRAYREPKVQFCLRHNGWGRADSIPPFLYVNSATALYEATVKAYDQRLLASDKALADLWQSQTLSHMAAHEGNRPSTASSRAEAQRRQLYPIPCAICFQYATGVTDYPDDDSASSSDSAHSGSRRSKDSLGSRGSNHSRRSNLAAGRIAPMGSVVMGPESSIMVVGFIGIVPTWTGPAGEFLKPPPTWCEGADKDHPASTSRSATTGTRHTPASLSTDDTALTTPTQASEWELVTFISKAAGDQYLSRALFSAAYSYVSECRRAGIAGCAPLPPLRYASFLTDVSFLSFLREIRLRAMDFRWNSTLSLASRQLEITADEPKVKSSSAGTASGPQHNRMLIGHLTSEQAMAWCSLLAEAQPTVGYHPIAPVPVYYFYGFVSVPVEANVLNQARGLLFWTKPSSARLLETLLKKSGLPSQGGPAILDLIAPQLPLGSIVQQRSKSDADDRASNKSTPGSVRDSADQLRRRHSPAETQRDVSLYAIVSLRPIDNSVGAPAASSSSRSSRSSTSSASQALAKASNVAGVMCVNGSLTTLVVRQRVNLLTGEFSLPSWQIVTDANEAIDDACAEEVVEWDMETNRSSQARSHAGSSDGGAGPEVPLITFEVLLSWIKGVYLRGRQADPAHVNWLRAFTSDFYEPSRPTPGKAVATATKTGTSPSAESTTSRTDKAGSDACIRLPLTRAALDAFIEQTQRTTPSEVRPTEDTAFLHIWDAQPPNVCTPGFSTSAAPRGQQKEGHLYMALIPDYVRTREEARKATQAAPASDPQIRKKDKMVEVLNNLAIDPRTMTRPTLKQRSRAEGRRGEGGDRGNTTTPSAPLASDPRYPNATHSQNNTSNTPTSHAPPRPHSYSQRSSSINSEIESGLASPTSTISNLGLQQIWVTGSQYNARGSQSRGAGAAASAGYRQRVPPAMTAFNVATGGALNTGGSASRRGSRRQDMFVSTPQSPYTAHSARPTLGHSFSSADSQHIATPMSLNFSDDAALSLSKGNTSSRTNTHYAHNTVTPSILVGPQALTTTAPAGRVSCVSTSRHGSPAENSSTRGSVTEYCMLACTASLSANDIDNQYGLQRGLSTMDAPVGYSTYGADCYDYYSVAEGFSATGGSAYTAPPPLQPSPASQSSHRPPQPTAPAPQIQRRLSTPVVPQTGATGATKMSVAPVSRARPSMPATTASSMPSAIAEMRDMYGLDGFNYPPTNASAMAQPSRHSSHRPLNSHHTGVTPHTVMVDCPTSQPCTPHSPQSPSSRAPASQGASTSECGNDSARGNDVHSAKEFLATSDGSNVYRWNWRNTTPLS